MEKEIKTQCPDCNGTGLYSGMGEGEEIAIICYKCHGTGAIIYSYTEFHGRKERKDIKRVYLSGYEYKIGLGKINYKNIGEIDMDKEGISYNEFLQGQRPQHIRRLACPLDADQSACSNIKGFKEECLRLGITWGSNIRDCKEYQNKKTCWKRFDKGNLN